MKSIKGITQTIELEFLKDRDFFWSISRSVNDTELGLLLNLLDQVPSNKPEFIINEIKGRTGGINIVSFDYEEDSVIIRNELDDFETGPFAVLKESNLYELIEKWAEYTRSEVPTIVLIRDGNKYGIKIG